MLAKSKHSSAPSDDASSVLLQPGEPLRAEPVHVDADFPVDAVRSEGADGHGVVLRPGRFDGLERGTFAQVRGRRGVPLLLEVVGDLDELEGEAVGIAEVHPPPPGQRSLVDDVDVGVELHALGLQLGLARPHVLDAEAHVGGSEVVVRDRAGARRRSVAVLDQLHHAVLARPQGDLAQRRPGHPDSSLQRRAGHPTGRLVGERQAEQVVVEVDRTVEVAHDQAAVVDGLDEALVIGPPSDGQPNSRRRRIWL